MVLEKKLVWTQSGRHATLRTLRISDITDSYLTALTVGPKYIRGAQIGGSCDYQRKYIRNIRKSKNDVLLGLFYDDQLIGTSGMQLSYSESIKKKLWLPLEQQIVTVGVFIFLEEMRSQGIGHCLLFGACSLFHHDMISSYFGAEIDLGNLVSIALFEKCGFSKKGCDDNNVILLARKDDLKRPNDMAEIKMSKDIL